MEERWGQDTWDCCGAQVMLINTRPTSLTLFSQPSASSCLPQYFIQKINFFYDLLLYLFQIYYQKRNQMNALI